MRLRLAAFVFASGLSLAGCRSCADDAGEPRGTRTQPAMPAGMLVPSPAASATAADDGGAAAER